MGLFGLPQLLGALTSPPFEVPGSESARASEVLSEGMPWIGKDLMLTVLHADGPMAADPVFRDATRAATAALSRQPGVTGVLPLPVAGDHAPVSAVMEPLRGLWKDPHTAYLVVGTSGDSRQRQDLAPAQRAAADHAAGAASAGAVHAYAVGVSAYGQAAQLVEATDLLRIELVAVPVAILVLLLGLRAVVAALLPVVVAGASVIVTFAGFAATIGVLRPDGMLLSGVGAVGLGVGVDYALFVVGRYREELAEGACPERAIGVALATSGRTVVYSGVIVFLSAAGMLLVRWPVFQQFAFGIAAVIVVALVASLTLLPALLVSTTRWLEWSPRWLRPGSPVPASGDDRLARWAQHLMRHPWPYTVGVFAGLLLLALPAMDLKLGFDLERRALAETPFGHGLAVMEQDMPGAPGNVMVLVRRPESAAEPGTGALLAALRADRAVTAVTKADNGHDLTVLVLFGASPADSAGVVDLVRRIRADIAPATAPPGTTVLVGGSGALMADVLAEVTGKLWWVVGIVLVLMFGLLVVQLRSLLLPLKAIVMNLLATASAFGLAVVLFQRGAAQDVLSFTSVGTVWPQIPILVFGLLFGLSMDYEMFLVRRIQEEYRRTGDNTASVVVGLRRTARPIALAAVILATAFGSVLLSRLTGLKVFGFTIAAALLIDATVIRLVLVPALMRILGRWNWWLPARVLRSPR
ncbi:MMPL family transporter [Amycolatopsis sp. H20-H5]|uniref:MMPL family transporter n=1 Tax=Amycolatopsis sp. H20-H5 TaxID=3046309 RepID=UPI002DBC17CB|nr:MMPL family transporter [Amycolatopsis sp. H20-H5]MEC3974507.1 MMPL family transporter [Amycolatopsis sp. H20-H5]